MYPPVAPPINANSQRVDSLILHLPCLALYLSMQLIRNESALIMAKAVIITKSNLKLIKLLQITCENGELFTFFENLSKVLIYSKN